VTGHRRTMVSPCELGATGMRRSSGGAGDSCEKGAGEKGYERKNI
jgi:hypothetical protein